MRKKFSCIRKKLSCVREKFLVKCCVREKFLVECCAGKNYQSPLRKTEYQRFKDIRAISRINKTTSTLFRYQKIAPVGACHDVGHMSYDNHLYNRTRLNQSIESLSRNRNELPCSALIYSKFSKKSHLGKKISKVSFCSQYSFVDKQSTDIPRQREEYEVIYGTKRNADESI